MVLHRNVLKKKYESLNEFKERLLKSRVKEKIAKIILFGSVLRGEARKDSDIDLLIITINGAKEVEEMCSDTAYQIMLERGETIMPMVHSVEELFYPRSYFFYFNQRSGKEIYTMADEEIKQREIQGYLELSKEYAQGAKRCLEHMDCRIALDAAYNALELAIKGLLLMKLDTLPSSHGGIINRFGELYIKAGEIEKEVGKEVYKSLELRHRARYRKDAAIEEADADSVINMANEIIGFLEKSRTT